MPETGSSGSTTFEHCEPLPNRKEEAKRQLQMLSAAGAGYLVITTIYTEEQEDGSVDRSLYSKSFTTDDIDRAVAYAMRMSRTHDVYVGTGLRDRPFNGSAARGGAEHIANVSAICVEVDWKDPAHKEQALPPTREAALDLIEAFGLRPTGIIFSGHGYHVWWRLSEPLIITDEASRKAAQELIEGFHQAFREPFTQRGYKLDPTHDLPRIMRVAGTVNRKKPDALKPVTVLRWDDDISYQPSELPQAPPAAKQSKPKTDQTNKTPGQKRKKTEKANAYPAADFDAVMTGCRWLQHVRDDAATLPEPEWHAAASIAVNCSNGRKHFHELSKPYPHYEEGETDLKLDRAEDAGPFKCSTIRNKYNGEPYCAGCPFAGGIITPLQLGRPSDGKTINVSYGGLPEQAAKAWAAVYQGNIPPLLYRLAQGLARLDRQPGGGLDVVPLGVDHLRHHIARSAPWTRNNRTGQEVPTVPPLDVVRDMLVTPAAPLPLLAGITQVPVFAPSGVLHDKPGYSPLSRRYLDARVGAFPPIPAHPTRLQIDAAVGQIDELLCDFPFVLPSHRAHAIALALQPFGRDFIAGPTPLHLIDKPVHGTGATLLARTLLLPALGSNVFARTQACSEEEWRKLLTATLLPMPQAVLFDNLSGPISSAALSSALTADTWRDRLLGKSQNVEVPINAAWVATGNNVRLSGELARRAVHIRLDAKRDRPWEGREFAHPLPGWAAEHRPALVHALLTLWSGWRAEGRPASSATLGSYEDWAKVMGGVLEVAGIDGFLHNLDSLYEQADEEGAWQRAFIGAWWRTHQSTKVTASDLLEQAKEAGVPFQRREEQQAWELGTLIGEMRDRTFDLQSKTGTTSVTVQKQTSRGKAYWKLVTQN